MEGREGRPVGTLFVIGDSDQVLVQSHQLVINPFHGYPENERNILDPRLRRRSRSSPRSTAPSSSAGTASSSRPGVPCSRSKLDEKLPQGLGTRHQAAAGITAMTQAIALCISQSTGTVSIFKDGRLITDIQKPWGRNAESL